MRAVVFVSIALVLPLACGKKKERAPLAPGATSAPSALQGLHELGSAVATKPQTLPPTLASELASAVAAPVPVSAAPSISALASASASTPVVNTLGPLATKLIGVWGFAAFDLTDEKTAAQWKAIGPQMQKDILAEAPKASLEFTTQKLISRLQGVPDKSTSWLLESETADELVIKTTDEGRKRIKFPMADAMRVEELDKKEAPITLFARRKVLPAPSASASASASK